jgi:cation transport ATPase
MNDVLTLTVPGMTCGHCEASVIGEVSKLAGVAAVDVDLTSKLVTVTGSALVVRSSPRSTRPGSTSNRDVGAGRSGAQE